MTDKLTNLEKLTLALLGAGNAFNVLLFGLGFTLQGITPDTGALWGWRVTFAWFNFLAFDLAAVVTIMSFREGRRGFWAECAALVAMLAGVLIAVDVAYGLGWHWLHALPIVVLYFFGRHLAAPRSGERVADLKAAVARLTAELAQAHDAVTQGAALAARAAEDMAQERHALTEAVTHAEQRAAQAERDAAQARRELARRPQEDGAAWLTYNGQRVTLAQLVEATGTPSATLRRKLARLADTTAQAAD